MLASLSFGQYVNAKSQDQKEKKMSNFINPSVLAAESLVQLEYDLVAGNLVYRDNTSDFSSEGGYAKGDTVTIRTATDLETNEFSGAGPITTQQVNQSKTPLVIEKHFDVSVEITARERALNLDGVRSQIIQPAMTSMAQKVDEYLLSKITESQGLYASSALLQGAADIAQANKRATLQQISKAGRIGLVNEDLEATLLGTDTFSKFDTRGAAGATALQEASLGRLMGVDWFSSVNMPNASHTAGSGVTTLDNSVSTNNLQGSKVLVVDSTTGTFNAGDKIQIAGAKRAFTVASQVVATSTSIPLVEEINENLNSLDGNAITVISTGNTVDYQGIFFNQGAFSYASPPLDPANSELSATLSANGMSIRVTEAYDIQTKKTFWSFDMLIGAKATDTRRSMLLGKF